MGTHSAPDPAAGGMRQQSKDAFPHADSGAARTDGVAAARQDLPIQVGDVALPGTLDRHSLVTRGPGTTLNVSDQDRWAAPLDELIRRAMTSDLRDRLGIERVLAPGDPRPRGAVLVVALNIQRFSGDSTGDVVLETDWTIGKTTPGSAIQTHHARLHVKAGSDTPDAITAAMSQALGQLADTIAAQAGGGGVGALLPDRRRVDRITSSGVVARIGWLVPLAG